MKSLAQPDQNHRKKRPFQSGAAGLLAMLLLLDGGTLIAAAGSVQSPDGQLTVVFRLNPEQSPVYAIQQAGRTVLPESRLGLIREDEDFSKGLTLASESGVEPVRDDYEILTAKRRLNHYRANRQVFHLATASGKRLDLIFQVSNDGVAFRYYFPETDPVRHRLQQEVTSFHFPPGTRSWLQPIAAARTGWKGCNPSYEEYYQKNQPVGSPSPTGAGWVYPALFRAGDIWMLVSEGSLPENYCGTRLRSASPGGEYMVGFPDPREQFQGGPVNPESTLPWLTPWRFIVVGSLKTIAESTLGTDLASPPPKPAELKGAPGKASWSWPLLGDGSANFDTQKQFIDYAARMGWSYTLVDALWDRQIGYDKLKELVDYGRARSVKILVWYNSAGDWNTTPQTPRNRMLTHESRVQEFDRLKAMGVAGLKVDFFGGDGQSMIGYYHAILKDAEPYGFLMNFHGATLPRGWQRTYPHLMTMEAIRGLEFVTFDQKNADQEPTHAAMLPFTRNVFDPMDFTPMVLDRIQHIHRRTSSAFELALSVLFTSGLQHYAEIPEGMAKAPEYVRDFLKQVPSVWEDIRFLDGYPGEFVVLARRAGDRWCIAGINGGSAVKKLSLDLSALSATGSGTLITDGDGGNLSFRQEMVKVAPGQKWGLTLPPCGGFVLVLPDH